MGNDQSFIATALFPSLAPRLPASMTMQSAMHGRPVTFHHIESISFSAHRSLTVRSSL
jgi:hypothetical protein